MSKQHPDRLEFSQPFWEQDWEECCSLLLSAVRSLHENGQETGETLEAISHLSGALGIKALLFPTWGELFMQTGSPHGTVLRAIATTPSNVCMSRVTATLRTIEAICFLRVVGADAKEALVAPSRRPPSSCICSFLPALLGRAPLPIRREALTICRSHCPQRSYRCSVATRHGSLWYQFVFAGVLGGFARRVRRSLGGSVAN